MNHTTDMAELKAEIKRWSTELGFQQTGVSDVDLGAVEARLDQWLLAGFHGTMDYMRRHGTKRTHPEELVPGSLRVVSVGMDYLPESQTIAAGLLDHDAKAYVSRYALGRDYHQVFRGRLR